MKKVLTLSSDLRWRKQINRKMHYFGRAKSKTDTRSYKEAEQRYFQFIADQEKSKGIERRVSDLTITDFGEKFLQSEFARYERGEIAASRFESMRTSVNGFVHHVGPDRLLDSLSEMDLLDYRNHILALPVSTVTNKPISAWTAQTRLAIVKLAIKWGYRHALIDQLPRNLDGFTRVKLPPPTVKIFSREEIQSLYIAADDRMKTWILLGLNCGFGQADLADLRIIEVDLKAGRIARKRTKTGVETRYALWPQTVEMIRKTGRMDAGADERVFVSKYGKPLVHERFVDDKIKKTDSVRSAFYKLMKKAGIEKGRGFYSLRKSAASEIEKIDPAVTEMFLGHVERGLKRHYAERDWERLDLAVGVLGDRVGLPHEYMGKSAS